METYDYAALDKSGKRLTGSVAASNPREARDILRSRQLTPVALKAAKARSERRLGAPRRVSHRDLTQATRQLSILIDAATPVEEAIKVVALQFEKSSMRQVLMDIRAQVLEGARLSDALRLYPKVFTPLYVAMVASGETSGRLGPVMDRLAQDLEAAQAVKNKISAAIAYPVVLSVVALIVVALLMIFLVPRIVSQFDSLGMELPFLTRAVIGLSNILVHYGLFILGAFFLIAYGIRRALKIEKIRLSWHKFLLGLPVIGNLIRSVNAARFARTMSGLIASGTPALVAMQTARHTLRNQIMYNAVSEAADKVREGSAISTSLRHSGTFPLLVTQMVAGGEASGDIGTMFGKSADYLEGEFERATAIFLSLLNPILIILLSIVVLVVILAMYMPMLNMISL